MVVYSVRIANVVIGQVALSPEALRQRALSARFEPGPAFAHWHELFDQYQAARLAAGRQALPADERHRNHELVEETLGFSLVAADGRRIGRITGLTDRSTPELGERWEVTALLDEPSYRAPRIGDGTV